MCERRYKELPDSEFENLKKPRFSRETSKPSSKSLMTSTNSLRQPRIPRAEHCLQFKRGKCDYGAKCIFSHVSTVANSNLFRPFMSEDAQEMIKKVKICWWTFYGNECPYGDRCKFLHRSVRGGFDFNRNVSLVDSVDAECRMGFIGMKRWRPENSSCGGKEMEESNVVSKKTRLCVNWEKSGTCCYGARCCFAHGEADLRLVDAKPAMGPANAVAGNALAVVTRDAESSKKTKTVYEKQEKGSKCYFKWNNIEKISQVYADWIDDVSTPVHVASV